MQRRDFLKTLAGSTAALWVLKASGAAAFAADAAWPGYDKAFVINNLGGLGDPNLRLKDYEAEGIDKKTFVVSPRILADLKASGMTAVNHTIGHVMGPGDPFEITVADIAFWNQVVRHNADALTLVRSVADIKEAKRTGRCGIILGFQNTTMLGDKAERVDTFAGLGVKVIQLTYNDRNRVGDGSMVAENRGLTAFGREVVERLNHARVLVDLSHSGEQTCLDAVKASKRPIWISHTGCRALADTPRNKTDAELRAVAEKGGMVGIYFMPFLRDDSFAMAEDAVRHIEHAIDICGEDHVGLGTDGGTTAVDDVEAFRAVIAREIEERRKAGISAKGEKPGVVTFLPDMQGPDQFRTLAAMLAKRGHSAGRIEKILGLNSLAFMREIWGA
ncbi:dipeptidase [Pseudokordiimonas caeni]|uniref:dipeptidase n=1 Tax=Pseudokordiimonas caeni TaxID=2997908 RepID=UPI002811088E|nr:membrane dipeptidase [Pseudokordiimonas caeni]